MVGNGEWSAIIGQNVSKNEEDLLLLLTMLKTPMHM